MKTITTIKPKNDGCGQRAEDRRIKCLCLVTGLILGLGMELKADAAKELEGRYDNAKQAIVGTTSAEEKASAFGELLVLAGEGHAEAAGALGYCYLTGTGTAKDHAKAIEWFHKGAEGGSAKAQLNYAKYLLGTLDKKEFPLPADPEMANQRKQQGFEWLRKAAAQRLPEAAADLGFFLYSGRYGLDKDLAASEPWVRIAAEAGDASCQNILGVLYERGFPNGNGVLVKDLAVAERWYREAAMSGDRKAQSNLGKLLDPFSKTRERRVEALSWILLAKENKEPVAEKRMMEITRLLNEAELQEASLKSQELKVEVIKHLAVKKQKSQ